jgi:hypothetical protein
MASDANLILQAATGRSTTGSSSALTIQGTPRRGMKVQVVYASGDAAGSASAVWSVALSNDGGSTFPYTFGTKIIAVDPTVSNGGEVFIPIEGYYSTAASPIQAKLVTTISGLSGTSSAINYSANIILGRPA